MIILEYARQLHEDLQRQLRSAEQGHHAESETAVCLGHVRMAIDNLKEKLRVESFDVNEDEMVFFKAIFPMFLSQMIYYSEKFHIESRELVGTPKSKSECYERLHYKIDLFFEENTELFKYYWEGRTDFDAQYFLRSSTANKGNMESLPSMLDISCCTLYSFKLATMLAFKRLVEDIHDESSKTPSALEAPATTPGRWTASKSALIELAYALKALGCFDNGTANLNTIVQTIERGFSVNLGNVSSSMSKIQARKAGHPSFFDDLKNSYSSWESDRENANAKENVRKHR